MCFVRLLLDCLPFVLSSMVLMLSWFMIHSSTLYHWPSRKYRVHIICGIVSSSPKRLDSVELGVLIFCLLDMLITDPSPVTSSHRYGIYSCHGW
jgi:hypothetical protein